MSVVVAVSTGTKGIELSGTDFESKIVRLNELRSALKELESAEKQVKQDILALMGNATVALINGVERLELKQVTRTDIDRAKLRNDFIEAWQAVSYSNPYTKIVTK